MMSIPLIVCGLLAAKSSLHSLMHPNMPAVSTYLSMLIIHVDLSLALCRALSLSLPLSRSISLSLSRSAVGKLSSCGAGCHAMSGDRAVCFAQICHLRGSKISKRPKGRISMRPHTER